MSPLLTPAYKKTDWRDSSNSLLLSLRMKIAMLYLNLSKPRDKYFVHVALLCTESTCIYNYRFSPLYIIMTHLHYCLCLLTCVCSVFKLPENLFSLLHIFIWMCLCSISWLWHKGCDTVKLVDVYFCMVVYTCFLVISLLLSLKKITYIWCIQFILKRLCCSLFNWTF